MILQLWHALGACHDLAGSTYVARAVVSYVYESPAIEKAAMLLGFPKLHLHQEVAVKTFVRGSDMFVCLPTGSGKLLWYIECI